MTTPLVKIESDTCRPLNLNGVKDTKIRCQLNGRLALTESEELAKKATSTIAGFTQSMMKKPEQFSPGHFPIYLATGDGALVRDVDGNDYIDFICGLGANALGHNHPAITQAINKALPDGLLHSLPTALEINATERLLDMIPHANMARFFKTGADANSAAVRLARHITGKEKIFTVGYNGWHDHFMYDTPAVPHIFSELSERLPLFIPSDEFALLEKLEQEGKHTAALILSVPYNRELSFEFMQQVQKTCHQNNILFVIDEVVTGFRLALGGAQEYFNVKADLATFSKSLGAGMPISAVAGDAKLMRRLDELQVSTTFGGERLSLACTCAALEVFQGSDCISRQKQLGKKLRSDVNSIAERMAAPLRILGYDAIPMFNFSNDMQQHVLLSKTFVGLMAERGVLLRRDVNFINAAHNEDHINYLVEQTESALQTMAEKNLWSN